jgi:predicted transcriptional regulator
MEVQFSAEQEAQILQIAKYSGTPAEQLVKQGALRMVEEETQFRDGVLRGIAQADRGELSDHEEVKARIGRLLRSR